MPSNIRNKGIYSNTENIGGRGGGGSFGNSRSTADTSALLAKQKKLKEMYRKRRQMDATKRDY